jgi:hypothetical protein
MSANANLTGKVSPVGSRAAAGSTLAIREALAERLVGRSKAMRCLRQRIEGIAPLWIPVLLCGEPGSGRATVAALLHAYGPTAMGDLLRVDASSFVPERRLPFFGTAYLEGVERLSRRAQAWWVERLRAEHAPSGGGLRWLASTGDSASLRASAPDFDPELERILARFALRVPPLRERTADLPLLVADLCARIGRGVGREGIRLSPQAIELLSRCHWPGNVRELEDVLGRAIVFSAAPLISRALLEDVIAERGESVGGIRARHALRERERLLAELRATGGNVTRTAGVLGKSRNAVYRLIEKHRIPLSWRRGGGGGRRPRARPRERASARRAGEGAGRDRSWPGSAGARAEPRPGLRGPPPGERPQREPAQRRGKERVGGEGGTQARGGEAGRAADENAVVPAGDRDPHAGGEERNESARGGGGVVEGVGREEAARGDAARGEGEAGDREPVGLSDRAAAPHEDVLEDGVEAAARALEEGERVGHHHLDAERVEVEVAPRGPHHLGARLDAHDARRGRERADHARGAPAAQAEDQDPAAAPGREPGERRGQRVPDRACERAPRHIEGGQGAVYAERAAAAAARDAHVGAMGSMAPPLAVAADPARRAQGLGTRAGRHGPAREFRRRAGSHRPAQDPGRRPPATPSR